MNEDIKWFCLDFNGNIHFLGNLEDFECADQIANSLRLDPVWIFNEVTAIRWKQQISEHIKG